MKHIIFIIGFILTSYLGVSQTFTSSQNGNYSNNSTWIGSGPDNDIASGVTVIINHNVINNQDIVVEGTLIINATGSLTGDNKKIEVLDGGKLIAFGLITTKELIVEGSNSRVEINDSIYVKNDTEVKDGAKLIVNGNAFFDKKVTLDDADSVFFNGNTFIDDDFDVKGDSKLFSGSGATITADKKMKVEDDAVINFDGNLIVNDDLEIKDDATFASNGTVLVENEFILKDDVVVNLFGDLRVNNDIEADDDILLNIFANAYIADDINADGNANITIGASSIVQVKDVLDFDGGTLTINGAMVVEGGVNTNESFNDGNIIGTGLLQVDGDGIDNQGTIAGSLDVCSGDGSTNPVSGNALSGSATSCSSSGINFPIIPGAPLPVDLLFFEVVKTNNDHVEITWATASQQNNHFFTVEKTFNKTEIITLDTIFGEGFNNTITKYFLTDSAVVGGYSYYRLTQTDFDGTRQLYDWVSVYNPIESTDEEINLYPNPMLNNQINIVLSNSIEVQSIQFFDLTGSQLEVDVMEVNIPNHRYFQIQFIQTLPKGLYVCKLGMSDGIVSKIFVVP